MTAKANGMGQDLASSMRDLFTGDDPPPVIRYNPGGRSPFLLIGDHAGHAIPARLGTLGLSAEDRARHIALDIGVAALGRVMADRLDAAFVSQHYSRLVIDCNRAPDQTSAIPAVSDGTVVPGNADLDPADRAARVAAIHAPYHAAIAATLNARQTAGRETVLLALHSFTPRMDGRARPWQIGILHDGGDAGFARRLLGILSADETLTVGDNEPYRMDLIDHSVPRHCYPTRIPYAEIEVRQDLIADPAGVAAMADILIPALAAARTGA